MIQNWKFVINLQLIYAFLPLNVYFQICQEIAKILETLDGQTAAGHFSGYRRCAKISR